MEKLVFADGEKIGYFDGERVLHFGSEQIARRREYAETRTRNDEWKYGGEGARFRGDYDVYRSRAATMEAFINGVAFDGEKIVYAFTADSSSGVYRKTLAPSLVQEGTDPQTGAAKLPEEHIFSSSGEEILSLSRCGGRLAVTVRRDPVGSSVGTLDLNSSELVTLTEGGRDANPCFSPTDPDLIYFDSADIGTDAAGNFTGKYAPSAILSFNLVTTEIKDVLRDKKYSYVKPKFAQNGDLYCIRRPTKERSDGNVFLDILLFPFRILKAIFGFLQAFVNIFGQTSLTSGTAGVDNPTRERKTDPRKLYIDGKLVEADKELKRNRRKKDGAAGFIPDSWKLVRISDGKEVPLASGVCDFALCRDGGFYSTNGRHIFYTKDGARKKIADTDSCLVLATECGFDAPAGFFD